ncbi:hypothetical protein [Methanococcoides alaskense]|uniref:Uncharacterized protein n=1 Tax=Methanococcoides alaskense TaxID=325778 RepID=A0AA90TXJ4_9EURY|nr:hypothetical protein [Methanococcoides alaskense]MDA0525305.1 hypothetical protein [Methanococcoides alaskense]MDR6221770.1 hypothetical protein [Methanococcoides alaskense]
MQADDINIPNLLDLLNQATNIVRNTSDGFKDKAESFYSGSIELPSGEKQQIFISLNEFGKYAIMLSEDH